MLSTQPVSTLRAPGSTDPRVRQACLAGWICALLAPLALWMDIPAARYFLADRFPGDLQRVLSWSEVFGHGMGVVIIGITVLVVDPASKWKLPRLLVSALGAGLAADIVKLLVARLRPRHFDLAHDIRDSFAGWLPLWNPVEGVGSFGYRLQSFPSAHAAVAMGLAVALAQLYPRGRYLFVVFAALAAAQRVEAGAHYVSDVFAGAAIGFLFGAVVTGSSRIACWFDRFEHARRTTRRES